MGSLCYLFHLSVAKTVTEQAPPLFQNHPFKNVQKKTAFLSENGRKLEIKGLLVKQLLVLIEITISIKIAQLSSIMLINRRRRWAHLEIAKIFLIYCGKIY